MDELAKLLANLDREGVTELVIGTNRPVTVREGGVYVALSREDVTKVQLGGWLIGTAFEPLIPPTEGTSPPTEITVHGRRVKATLNRKGKDLIVRIVAGAPGAPSTASAPAGADAPRAKKPTKRPATKRPTRDPLNLPLSPPPPPPPAPAVGFDFELDGPAFELDAAQPGTVPIKGPTGAVGASGPFAPTVAGKSIAAQQTPASPVRFATAGVAKARVPSSIDIDFDPTGSGIELAEPTPIPTPIPIPTPAPPPAPKPIAAPRAVAAVPVFPKAQPLANHVAALVVAARQRGASDLHIAANRPVMIRAIGSLVMLEPTPWTPAEVEAALLPLLGDAREQLDARGYADVAIVLPGAGRVRGNISRQQGGLKGSFRLAFPKPPTLEELALPKELAKVVSHHQGLVVLAGPSGHGKTTTLAALVDLINETRAHHVLTIEDPVEIEHPRKKAVISQRQVGAHTRSFAAALKASLREDPDVIVIGELRDRESVEIALTAAETGHLVMATMSTPSAAKTIDRLIDMFPPDDQSQVRASLAGALRAIVAQRLLPRADGSGVVPAVELLTGVLPLAALIRNNQLFQLPNLMQRGRAFGMIRLDDSLIELVRSGVVDEEVALRTAENKKEMLLVLHPPPVATPATAAAKKGFGLGGMFGKKDDR